METNNQMRDWGRDAREISHDVVLKEDKKAHTEGEDKGFSGRENSWSKSLTV